MRIFLVGGTGLVGARLIAQLLARQDQIVLLTRRPDVARQQWGEKLEVVAGDPMNRDGWPGAVRDCEAVVNLVGEGIFNRRWSAAFKEVLRASRVQTTEQVVASLAGSKVKTLINASAIGYYGATGDEPLTEAAPPGVDDLAQLCVAWEQAARKASEQGVRVAILRVGVVLDPTGGALKKMLLPFKWFMGGKIGSGRQFVSWIHHADLVGIILLLLDQAAAAGPVNATAPNPVTNQEFAKALGRALHRPSFMPTPAFMLRLFLGQVANVITKGQKVLPKKALDLGYQFQFPTMESALAEIFPQ